jgi:hypothetical protein
MHGFDLDFDPDPDSFNKLLTMPGIIAGYWTVQRQVLQQVPT